MAMDAFEQFAADIFWNEGYWVRTSVKVELTREDKARIQSPSSPRWELDLVAYSPLRNELLALECKSYLDSGGVHAAHFQSGSKYAHRYKLFHDDVLRETVLGRLQRQFASCGLCGPILPSGSGSSMPMRRRTTLPCFKSYSLVRDGFFMGRIGFTAI